MSIFQIDEYPRLGKQWMGLDPERIYFFGRVSVVGGKVN